MKQALVIRRDLGMGTGKVAAQAAHASLQAYEHAEPADQRAWKQAGQKKIVLSGDDEAHLHQLNEQAIKAGLPQALISDAGHTELTPGTTTALAVGPAEDSAVDAITGDLGLF